jgi:hypothetical protein
MKGSWTVSRILAVSGILTMIVGGIGFIVGMALNPFVLDEFDAFKSMRGRRQPAGVGLQETPPLIAPVDPYTPTDDGVRLEQLKTISALRDSGALTPEEFEAEKRRILGS